ncbi:glutathione S-transferase N-terminal domain-containing protein [Actimicrobium sp. CCC2.4]|uniref:glutathione S-transferase family protein n=1 Tax=Actimicrobium sp. CCC2.4 TaxID=3048606 RepID=UPI002AC91EE3|nr:glutathione S-transferase N-terminal domain-containing protein [Actimicrobium sp. CCC2.4]MEB0136294.1 glutathione S-transferase N-terminal domain-containing protein [Actimicrobium sp. CCC2.4]WPX33635.1 glutathione S-transferase N-terminal domain-containing protein [Actimicrobium sp. CCC2.4]
MIQLYYAPGNANLAPHILLEELGIPHELVLVDRDNQLHRGEVYRKLNPNGLIPVLVDGELVLYETAAICLHLADTHPGAQLAPPLASAARAHCYKWLMHLTNTVQAEMITYFYPERMVDDAVAAAQVKAHAEARLAHMFDLIDAELAANGPYLLGAQYSIVDPYLFMLSRWSRMMARPARERGALGDYLAMMAQRPAVQRAFAAEGIAAPFC